MDHMDVFLSFSTNDSDHARDLADELAKANISSFLAEKGNRDSDPFEDENREALEAAKELFVILSPNSIDSAWVTVEYAAAWALRKHIVPILFRSDVNNIPRPLQGSQIRDIAEISKIIEDYRERRENEARIHVSASPTSLKIRSQFLLFDIDGTVLEASDTLSTGVGQMFCELLTRLAAKRLHFVFITGNDFNLQNDRLLQPIIGRGLGPSIFCFSDGGSRAFEFNSNNTTFDEIGRYSADKVMGDEDIKIIEHVFEKVIEPFLEVSQNHTLLNPDLEWYDRTLDHLDLRIFPLRRSFVKSTDYKSFCDDIRELFEHPQIDRAGLELIESYPGGLIIRAHGRSVDADVGCLMNLMFHELLLSGKYPNMSRPEIEKRGGEVTCQIALKPFKGSYPKSVINVQPAAAAEHSSDRWPR